MADETTDISNREQLVICLRYIDDQFVPQEIFVGFYEVDDIKADTIVSTITDTLTRFNIPFNKLRGQCYDMAASMAGSKSVVAKQILEKECRALYPRRKDQLLTPRLWNRRSNHCATPSCDFLNDTCGWSTPDKNVKYVRFIAICGFRGSLKACILSDWFQDGDPWTPRQIHSINLNGIPVNISERLYQLSNTFVLATILIYSVPPPFQRVSDIVSSEIPLSMEHRCLQYSHLVLGNAALVVAYIKDYFEPFELSNYLSVHGNSFIIEFSTSSTILPVGVKFKIVFRAVYDIFNTYGLVFLYNISITEGVCNSCSPDEFRCSPYRVECVPLSRVCDLQPDCLNGEDEKGCDFTDLKFLCTTNLQSTYLNASVIQEEKQWKRSVESKRFRASQTIRLKICYDGHQCQSDPSYICFLSCPSSCTCSGLSFNCLLNNAPVFATSVTFTGLVQKILTFNESYLNLKEIKIFHCKLQILYVSSVVFIEPLHISHSLIDIVLIEDETEYLRFVSVVNSSFEYIRLWNKIKHTFKFHVHKSTVKNSTDILIADMVGVHVDLSESRGFPFIIHSFYDNPLVNFSFCNLSVQPNSVIETVTLDLSYNLLTKWHMSPVVQILHLQGNLLETINFTFDFKKSEARLQYLDLSHNYIKNIEKDEFVDLPNILYLKIRNNSLLDIHENAFSVISNLIDLDLSNNRLCLLKRSHFIHLSNIKYLYLQNNNIKVIEGMFDGLINIQYLQVDSYTLCCAQPKAVGKIRCLAPVNEISSCYNLIDTPLLSISIWYIALLSVFGNLLGLLYRLLVLKERKVTSFVIYSINLGLADFFMGVYLYILAGANLMFSGRYGFEDDSWRQSPLCTFAGVLATTSSEASALFVLSITIDRIVIIRFPFSQFEKNRLVAKLVSVLVWTISLSLSVLPLFGNQYFNDYYSSSGICISLPLSVLRKPGWEYSMVIFVGANFLIFIAILLGQFVIFTDVVGMGKEVSSQRTTQKKREINLAKTLIMVAVTDMFCWIPIGVIGLLTFFGIDVTAKVYAWVIVVVLPINSALNPIIYTFSAILRRRGQKV
ncbi:uncharacterized protein LOC133202983 [Saccostrea echinata]|uniref:uncharacterized protein LOC133202983 n=1 Tax=Saccostrea echinata TaxID=191078 RepID=UPI002A7F1A7C|nr:uncharacterized protein LOC133202983 [Saccostrea echinata]